MLGERGFVGDLSFAETHHVRRDFPELQRSVWFVSIGVLLSTTLGGKINDIGV